MSDFAVYTEDEDPPRGKTIWTSAFRRRWKTFRRPQASAEAAAETAAEEVEEEQEDDALGATMTQDQLDALFAGDVVSAFAGGDDSTDAAEDALAAVLGTSAEAEEAEAVIEEEPAE